MIHGVHVHPRTASSSGSSCSSTRWEPPPLRLDSLACASFASLASALASFPWSRASGTPHGDWSLLWLLPVLLLSWQPLKGQHSHPQSVPQFLASLKPLAAWLDGWSPQSFGSLPLLLGCQSIHPQNSASGEIRLVKKCGPNWNSIHAMEDEMIL